MRRWLGLLLITVLTAQAQAATAPVRGRMLVLAAASLTDAFGEVGRVLERQNPDLRITFNFAASSLLRTQILQGARADVFASADERNMQQLQEAGLLWTRPVIFARNEPVVVVPASNRAGIGSVRDLARPGLKIVVAAPEVPIGAYTRVILTHLSHDPSFGADFAERVLRNVASQEPNVRASLARVALGEADATFVYRSDLTSEYGPRVRVIEIPRWANVIAAYPIAVVRGAPNPLGARRFIEFVLSEGGQRILVRWGFLPARD
jgi:molybdate transport system substrate-binding protein